jgi:hypothetical protein
MLGLRKKRKFPTFATILLVLGLVWLASSAGYIAFELPWMPIALVIIAIGMIYNRLVNE